MSASLLEVVEHYQKKVERHNDEDKILHCFDKLQRLPITVDVLSQTGVGKTVNAFRRDPGPVGIKSRELVSKWKRIFEEEKVQHVQHEQKTSSRANGDDKKRRKGGDAIKEEKSRTPSPIGSEGSDRLEIDEVTVKQEQKEEEERERRRAARAEERVREKQEEEEKRRAARAKEREVRIKREVEEEDEGESESEVVSQVNEIRVKEEKEEDPEHHKRLVQKQMNGTSSRVKDKDKARKGDKSHRESDKKHSSSHKSSSSSSKDKVASNHSRGSESSHSSSSKHRKEGHRKESKHKRNDSDTGDSASDLFSVVKTEPLSSDDRHRVKEKERDKHREKHKPEKTQSRSEKHSSSRLSESDRVSPSSNGVHPSSGRDRTSHPAGETSSSPPSPPASSQSPSKHKHKNDHSSSSKHPRESSSKHDHAERDSSREARKSKHKSSKRDKHKSDESAKTSDGKASRAAPKLKEVDFLALPGSSAASDGEDAGGGGTCFADALGGMGPTKKKKKKSKSSSSTTSVSSASSTITPSTLPDVPPPLPPPPVELLDALPEVPIYRPLPRPPVSAPPARTAAKRLMDEEEALASVLHNKNKRSKVYSGNKGTGLTRLPTLTEIALRCLQDNVDYLEFTGGVPYDILRPVLERCSAAQLHNIEYYNPYLMEDTDPLWEALVKKEFKTEKRQEMETWREMHSRCSEEREHKYNKLRSLIEGKRKDALASSRKTKVAFEHTVAKPPRNVARKQAQNGTAIPVSMPTPTSQLSGSGRPSRPAPGTDPTSRPAAASRAAAPPKKKAPLMAKVLRAMGRR